MKNYPLEIESIGADTYMLMSKGHQDFTKFMEAVSQYRDWSMGNPEHVWFKTVPARGDYSEILGFDSRYMPVEPGTRGAWPATLTVEAYAENKYKGNKL